MKLLLIEDSQEISNALQRALFTDYSVDLSITGTEGIQKALDNDYDAILLDLNLPDVSGISVCKAIRQANIKTPILVLTGDSKVLSKINLLDAGADDYLTKPFSLGELKVRLRVLIRRSAKSAAKINRLVVDDLELDVSEHSFMRQGKLIHLRRKEFAIMECLMLNAGEVVSRDSLMSYAWSSNDEPWRNTVDVHIKYLRDKIDRPFDYPVIKTVHGLGYKINIKPKGALLGRAE